jgi:transposase
MKETEVQSKPHRSAKIYGRVRRFRQLIQKPDWRFEPEVFSSFTADLHALADWVSCCQVTTVALESTGVYWIAIFQILETRGFDVDLVNAHYIKNVTGKKTDIMDSQWIQQ